MARDLAGTFGEEIKYNLLDPWALQAKRTLDLALTAVGGILISPFSLALCLLVYLESRGHVFHKDQRMGRGGKLFSCIKFRTMVPDAEALLQTEISFSDRVRMDAHYVRNWSVWLDLVILARTMKSVVLSGSFLTRRRS